QDETPTLTQLIGFLAELLGAPSRVRAVPLEALTRAGLELRMVSPFSSRWMSCLDPSLAKTELGFRHEPLREYLGRIVSSFLAHPPAAPPPNYARRQDELALAEKP
ncbi:MAG TPA: epimerase, partial [Planctomycetota bacterium]|nr:epimerase [Planctomycetota bacterium]